MESVGLPELACDAVTGLSQRDDELDLRLPLGTLGSSPTSCLLVADKQYGVEIHNYEF